MLFPISKQEKRPTKLADTFALLTSLMYKKVNSDSKTVRNTTISKFRYPTFFGISIRKASKMNRSFPISVSVKENGFFLIYQFISNYLESEGKESIIDNEKYRAEQDKKSIR